MGVSHITYICKSVYLIVTPSCGFCNYGPIQRWVDGAQYHILSYLGPWWLQSPPRFPTELVVGYTRYVNARQGVVTWDVPPSSDGRIPEPFLAQLRQLKAPI